MCNFKQIRLFFLFCSLITAPAYSQKYSSFFLKDYVVASYENYYERLRKETDNYRDEFVDTLEIKGKEYYFRRSPLSLKRGYSNIFPICTFSTELPPVGHKGYTVRWLVRHDSLFIKNIYPDYKGYGNGEIEYQPPDTIESRFEAFTGNVYKNHLLHVDWISGEFGILQINPNAPARRVPQSLKEKSSYEVWEGDYIGVPMLLKIKNGKVVKMKKDKRKHKD